VPWVVFYISGHGFGHASRDIEVLNAVGRRAPGARLVICTAASRWFFDLTMRVPFEFREVEADTGLVQRDSINHDIQASLEAAAAFYRDFEPRVETEAAFLRSLLPRPRRRRFGFGASRGTARPANEVIVLGDIPPLAFAAASKCGLSSYAIGNFTWDWIYEGYEETESVAPGLVARLREAHSRVDEAWRLPMHGGFDGCRSIVDVPFVARHSTRSGNDVRRAFGLPVDRLLVLSSFGGYGLGGLPLDRLDCLDRYAVVTVETGAADPGERRATSARTFTVNERDIYGRGYRYEDLVRAVDVVLTKPGFGIISECLANDTALVYTSRGRFREYDVLVREMPEFLRCRFLPQEDLLAGRWRAALDQVLEQPAPPTRPRTDGAELIAAKVLQRIEP
jgi:L-arabinokinase